MSKQFPISIIYRHYFVDDAYSTTIDINIRLFFWICGRCRRFRRWSRFVWNCFWWGVIIRINFHWSVPFFIIEQSCDTSKIHNNKMRLTLFFTQTSASANDLLKFSHRTDIFIQYNQFCHFAIRTSWKQLWCCSNHRIWWWNGNKIIKFLFSIIVWTSNSYHIVRIFGTHICI